MKHAVSSFRGLMASVIKRIGHHAVIAIPMLWFLLLFCIPFAILLKISFSDPAFSIPPYSSMTHYSDQALTIRLSFSSYISLLSDNIYLRTFFNSIELAFFSTILCILIGYPIAYGISRTSKKMQGLLILLIMLPSWTSFLIRIYAWMNLLGVHGLLNNLLIKMGVIDSPLVILNTNIAVYIGIVYSYLPYMILPVYTSLIKIPSAMSDAACDLGAKPFTVFSRIILPLSSKGVLAGVFLVFIPVVGEVMIPQLLGGPDSLMVGNLVWQTFFNNNDWPTAASLAIVMLVILLLPIRRFNRMEAKSLSHEEK